MWEHIHVFKANVKAELTVLILWSIMTCYKEVSPLPHPLCSDQKIKEHYTCCKKHDLPFMLSRISKDNDKYS